MRLVHISDLHFWHVTLNPAKLAGKRILGMVNLVLNRARKYRMETMPAVIARVQTLEPDHILITGDLTTTSMEQEFEAVRAALAPLRASPAFLSIVPGNHDRYTRGSRYLYEKYFSEFSPCREFPWVKRLDSRTSLLALDASHPNFLSAAGTIAPEQLRAAQLLVDALQPGTRTMIACHYPVAVPGGFSEKRGHGLRGVELLREFLRLNSPNIYCHGHIHMAWSFTPSILPRTLCLNPGAVIRRSRTGVLARIMEIVLDGEGVQVRQHQFRGGEWIEKLLADIPRFFERRS